jgi:hypothetical protein
VAAGVQRRVTEEGPRRADARLLCKTAEKGNEHSHRRTLKGTATQDGGRRTHLPTSIADFLNTICSDPSASERELRITGALKRNNEVQRN